MPPKSNPRPWRACPLIKTCCLCICLATGCYMAYTYAFNAATLPLHCPGVQVHLSPSELPLTALVSFPGSGNTWLRHLVQQATGIGTGSVYCDKGLQRNGFPWECIRNRSVIMIKNHELLPPSNPMNFTKIVILLRNPFDAFRAEYNRRKSGHTGLAPVTMIREWPTTVRKLAEDWGERLQNWANFKGPIYVIRYEDLLKDLPNELSRLLQFLEIPVPMKNIQCAAIKSEGRFHRQKQNKSLLYFDSDLTALVQDQLAVVSSTTDFKLDIYSNV